MGEILSPQHSGIVATLMAKTNKTTKRVMSILGVPLPNFSNKMFPLPLVKPRKSDHQNKQVFATMLVSRQTAVFLISTIAGAAAFSHPASMLPRVATRTAGQRASSVAMAGLPFGISLRLPSIFEKVGLSMSASSGLYPIVGEEDIMKPKAHGTTDEPVQPNLR
jgi:hypothetical protein